MQKDMPQCITCQILKMAKILDFYEEWSIELEKEDD